MGVIVVVVAAVPGEVKSESAIHQISDSGQFTPRLRDIRAFLLSSCLLARH